MQFKDKYLALSQPRVMGILNVTPDSFSDGGSYTTLDKALIQAERLLAEGADFIDIGGESTRPGAAEVSEQEELDRVVPVVEAITQRFDTIISVDTSKAGVMTESVKAGAGLINDIRSLSEPGALRAAAESGAAVCVMHMQGQPRTMQLAPDYADVVADVMAYLGQQILRCEQAGIRKDRILLDPGFGFGKNLEHNYTLLAKLAEFHQFAVPLLIGMSRKTMIGQLLNRKVDERLAGSITVAAIAAQKGAQIIRVHDVKETVDALKIVAKVKELE